MAEKNLKKIVEIKEGIKGTLKFSGADKPSFDKDFYKDVDRIRNQSCCTLPFLIVFLVIIFGLIVYGLIYIKNYTHSGIGYLARNQSSMQSSLTDKFVDQTKNIQPGETLALEFSEVEVSQYLGISDPDFPLKKARLKIREKGIVVNGRMSDSFLALPVEICIRPKIDQGKLLLILDDIETSSVSLPKFVRDKINAYLDMIMRSRTLYDENLEIITAATLEQILRLEIHKKN